MKSELMTKSDSRLERKLWVCATIVVMALVAGIGLMPRVSEASCFYNLVDKGNVKVEFDCGLFCGNTWDLGPGEHKCRPGKGGTVQVKRKKHFCDFTLNVEKHGWVEVTRVGDQGRVVSKSDNGQVIRSCTFDWGN